MREAGRNDSQRAAMAGVFARSVRARSDLLAVIAVGGALGSAARYGVAEAMPHHPGSFPWSTVTVNVAGAFLLGLLMVFLMDVWPPTRYVRPFLAVGVLGGFTTFSTYMVDAHTLLAAGAVVPALAYVLGTLVVGLAAVWLGMVTGRWLSRTPGRRRARMSRGPTPRPTRRSGR